MIFNPNLRTKYSLFCLLFPYYLNNIYASDLYHNEDVLKYSEAEFKLEVPKKNHFIKFFAPWCGHCKRLNPIFSELAEKNKKEDNIVIAKVDCTIDTALCAEHGITGYPTLMFFKIGSNDGTKYRGSRDLAALQSFIDESLGKEKVLSSEPVEIPKPQKGLTVLTDADYEKVTAHGHHFIKFYAPWCKHCQILAPIWEDLATTFQHDSSVTISKVDCTVNRAACTEMEVKAFPTLLWIVDGKKVDRYQGGRTHEELKAYVSQMKQAQNEELKASEDGKILENEEDEAPAPIVVLNSDNFDASVSRGVTFVKFYAPWCGHCRRLAPTWENLGRKFMGKRGIKIADVDCTQEDSLCENQKVEGYPTLIIFRNGEKLQEYQGSRELEDLYNFVQENVIHDEL